ncbi:MAG: DUF202 domain-containing protein [Ilumatobacteraceae bacterium]
MSNGPARPTESFDDALPHERTALAWERTAISMMVAGILLARFTAQDHHVALSAIGLALTVFGGAVLVWAGAHYEALHGPLRDGDPIVHPTAARTVGIVTVIASGSALVFGVIFAL